MICKLGDFELECFIMENKKGDLDFMREAFKLAEIGSKRGEVPVGAVVVLGKKIIGKGCNLVIKNLDPTSHAEIVALREAGKKIKNFRILDAVMYVTLEPCLMCFTAMVNARIKRLVFAAFDRKTGVFSTRTFDHIKETLNHSIEVETGIMKSESSRLLKEFFKERRGAGAAERGGLENR